MTEAGVSSGDENGCAPVGFEDEIASGGSEEIVGDGGVAGGAEGEEGAVDTYRRDFD